MPDLNTNEIDYTKRVGFTVLSPISLLVSYTAGEFSGYSSNGFNALRTLSSTETTAATIARFVTTLVSDLMRNKS